MASATLPTGMSVPKGLESHTKEREVIRITDIVKKENNSMTDKEKIRNIIELFIAWNGETEAIDVANLDSAVDFIADSLQ